MLRVQVKVEEAEAEIVKGILTKIFASIKPLCGKYASQGAVVYKRTLLGTSTSRKLLAVTGRGSCRANAGLIALRTGDVVGPGRGKGEVSAASSRQGRKQENVLPRRLSHRHGGLARSTGFGVAPGAALHNLASKSDTRSAIRFHQAPFLKVANESQSSPPAEFGSGKGAGQKVLNAPAPTHPRLRSSPREEICLGKGHVK